MRGSLALVPARTAMVASAIAACATAPPPPPAAPSLPHAELGVDGLYRPPPGGARGNAACRATSFADPIRVVDGVASLQLLEGRIAPDGSLVIQQGRMALRGQFSGNRFSGTYSRTSCTFFLAYRK